MRDIDKLTGTEMRALRERLGWTQAQLAEALGLTRRWVIKLESGKAPLTRLHRLALAGLEGQAWYWLLERRFVGAGLNIFKD